MVNSWCIPSKCKVKRLTFFAEVEAWKEEGATFTELHNRIKERDPDNAPSTPSIAEHFNNHYAPTKGDLETFSPERMAKLLDENITTCSKAIKHLEGSKDPDQMRVMAQLMDTQKRLLELKLQNQQMFLTKEQTLPEQFDHLKAVLKELPAAYTQKILQALELDIYGGS